MVSRKRPSPRERVSKLRAAAKQEVAIRGTVQFRLDEESMLNLMKAADDKKMPLGTLVRMWVVERLREEEYGI